MSENVIFLCGLLVDSWAQLGARGPQAWASSAFACEGDRQRRRNGRFVPELVAEEVFSPAEVGGFMWFAMGNDGSNFLNNPCAFGPMFILMISGAAFGVCGAFVAKK